MTAVGAAHYKVKSRVVTAIALSSSKTAPGVITKFFKVVHLSSWGIADAVAGRHVILLCSRTCASLPPFAAKVAELMLAGALHMGRP